jgi:AcrR family transcriptional regulator
MPCVAARSTHRERKKQRTRQALINEARRLFDQQGYEATTVAQIAEAAGVSPRTFFTYFASKEDVLHDNSAERVEVAVRAIRTYAAEVPAPEALARAVEDMLADSWTMGLVPGMTGAAVDLPITSPKAALARSNARLDRLAAALADAYPATLDRITAYALVGAAFGTVSATVAAALTQGCTDEQALDAARTMVRRAVAGVQPGSGR